MVEKIIDRRKDLEIRQAIERIKIRYEKQTGETSTEVCSQPRRLFESLLFEMLADANCSYGCVMRQTGAELAESPFLELVSSISRTHSGRLARQYDTLLNRKPDTLVSTVVSTGHSQFVNNKRSLVPKCLPDCRPPIESFAVLRLVTDKQSPMVVFIANAEKPLNEATLNRLDTLLTVFARIFKGAGGNKQTQVAIQRYQQDNRHHLKLLDANFNGVMTIDSEGIITAFNLACERYFEVASVVALGKSANTFLTADVLDPLLEQARSFPKEMKFRDVHTTAIRDSVGFRADGADFPIQIAAFFSRVEHHVCVTLVLDDISDRYESARESEKAFVQMKTLTNLAPVGILQLAADWSCQYANDMWFQLSDLTLEESLGEGWINAIHREDVVDTLDEMRDALCQHQIFKKEIRLHQPLGAVAWVSVNATATVDEQHRLTGFLVVVIDITEKHHAAERLRQLAHHDALTGLLNRMFFLDHLEEALHARETDRNVGLLSIDLDGFKSVNDNFGHDAGDTLLKEVASRLQASARDEDIIARLGGDEFVVTLSHLFENKHAVLVAEKVLDVLKKPFVVGNVEVRISASIGIATSSINTTSGELMKQADLALYRAKELGKSVAVVFTPELDAAQRKLAELNSNVRTIVKNRDFILHYQPQLDIHGQRLLGFEALLRMPGQFGHQSMPSEIIEVLEDTGLIQDVGAWALTQACHDFGLWRDAGLVDEHCTMSVNVSAKQLQQEKFLDTVINALSSSQVPASRLILELTESAFIGNTDGTVEIIHQIKALNVKVSLDDFGTGYSSLAYLSRLPIDHLKIDKSFVLDLGKSEERLAIVRAILAMANALNITVVAEGVETPEVVQLLAAEGCDAYQGYYFSNPMCAESAYDFLTELNPLKLGFYTSFYDLGDVDRIEVCATLH